VKQADIHAKDIERRQAPNTDLQSGENDERIKRQAAMQQPERTSMERDRCMDRLEEPTPVAEW
jgi:hypothetical protein